MELSDCNISCHIHVDHRRKVTIYLRVLSIFKPLDHFFVCGQYLNIIIYNIGLYARTM